MTVPYRSTDGKRHPAHCPTGPKCPLHLRRVCGVCVHFAGRVIRQDARCSQLNKIRVGTSIKADCEFWARKTAGLD